MVLTLVDEQVDEEADSVKGDETVELLEGLLTVTPARAGSESVRAADNVTVRFLKDFINRFPLRFEGTDFADSPLAFVASAGRRLIQLLSGLV